MSWTRRETEDARARAIADSLDVMITLFLDDTSVWWRWLNDLGAHTSNPILAQKIKDYFIVVLGHAPTFTVLLRNPKDIIFGIHHSCSLACDRNRDECAIRVDHSATAHRHQIPMAALILRKVAQFKSEMANPSSSSQAEDCTIESFASKGIDPKLFFETLEYNDPGLAIPENDQAQLGGADGAWKRALGLEEYERWLVNAATWSQRSLIFRAHLSKKTSSTETALFALFDLTPRWSETLFLRAKMRPRILVDWLGNRSDLLPLVPLLTDASYLGWFALVAVVGAACVLGPIPILKDLSAARAFNACHKCVLRELKLLKEVLRENTGNMACVYVDAGSFQYIDHLLGRYDDDAFMDWEDVETRDDYDKLKVRNQFYGKVDHLLDEVESQMELYGERFGQYVLNNPRYAQHGLLPLSTTALTTVPQGSIPGRDVPGAAEEVHPNDITKKLAFAYMTAEEEDRLCAGANLHSRSSVAPKLEVAKMRNIVPGSTALYALTARLSALGEDSFLASLPEVPLMLGEQHRNRKIDRFVKSARKFFVTARDYKNFNIRHRHVEMKRFYLGVRRYAFSRQAEDVVDCCDKILICLDDVGVYKDGQFYKWTYGLMTGWRHTMLFHCVFNTVLADVVTPVVCAALNALRLDGLRQGDDSAEIWNHPLAGPLMQAILDAMGAAGQMSKQHFASVPNSWFEFLRVNYHGNMRVASALRGLSGLWGGDSQHPILEPGPALVASLVDDINVIWRRNGRSISLRIEDLGSFAKYWATPTVLHKHGFVLDWRVAFVPANLGGYGARTCLMPSFKLAVPVRRLKIVARSPLTSGVLPRLQARKLPHLSQLNLTAYAHEYSDEFLASTGRVMVVPIPLTPIGHESDGPIQQYDETLQRDATYIINKTVATSLEGIAYPVLQDELAVESVVGALFAGSNFVARAYLRDHSHVAFMTHKSRFHTMIGRGLALLMKKGPTALTYNAPRSALPAEWTGAFQSNWALLHNNPRLEEACVVESFSSRCMDGIRV